MMQSISLLGATLILLPFAANQVGRLSRDSVSYQVMNLLGSSLLEWVALVDGQFGFILLEAVWALVSVLGLVNIYRQRGTTA